MGTSKMDCRAMSGKEPGKENWRWKLYPRVAGIVQTHRHRVDAVQAEPGQQQVAKRTETCRHRSTSGRRHSSGAAVKRQQTGESRPRHASARWPS